MSKNIDTYQLIQDALRGDLSPADQRLFDQLLDSDAKFKTLYEEELMISSSVKALMLDDISADVSKAFANEKAKAVRFRNWKIGGGMLLLAGMIVLGTLPVDERKSGELRVESESEELELSTRVVERESGEQELEARVETGNEREREEQELEPRVKIKNEDQKLEAKAENGENENQPLIPNPTTNENITSEVQQPIQSTTITIETPTIEKTTETISPCLNINISLEIIKTDPCLFDTPGTIEVIASGGKAPYSYKLESSSSKDGYFDNLAQGSYTISATDYNACTSGKEVATLNNKRCTNLEKAFNAGSEWRYNSNYQLVELKIMNRFGAEVYNATEENPSWDGKNQNGEMMKTDDYIFIISKDGQVIDKGNVTLVR